ncbi:MAG TPA: hypothetical protein VF711_06040 [Acidimicrobiales bacterium]
MTVGLAGGAVAVGAGPAAASGATTIRCSAIFPELGGTIVIGPSGTFNANCWEHFLHGTATVETTLYDCSVRLPDFPPENEVGIQVVTKSGNTLTNCLVHF